MKGLVLISLIYSLDSLACWNIKATFSHIDKVVNVNQKMTHDKTYSFGADNYLFHLKMPAKRLQDKTSSQFVEWVVQKRKGVAITEVGREQFLVSENQEKTVVMSDPGNGEKTFLKITISDI